jgi:CRP-like cAMP-binding protein
MREVAPVSQETACALASCLEPCHFDKHVHVLEEGRMLRYVWFIEQGLLRHYWLVNGDEINTSFSIEGHAVFSMDELYYGMPSQEYAETLESVYAYRISISDMNRLFATNLELCNWGRIIHQNEYRRLHQSHKDRLSLSAAERYLSFIKQFPDVCQRCNLGYIASYLGITLPTLSRLRSKFLYRSEIN